MKTKRTPQNRLTMAILLMFGMFLAVLGYTVYKTFETKAAVKINAGFGSTHFNLDKSEETTKK